MPSAKRKPPAGNPAKNPFAKRIFDLDADGLTRFFQDRPDLARPEPASLDVVVARAESVPSVQSCLNRLDRFALHVVQALAIAGSFVTSPKVLDVLGPDAPEEALDRVLADLERLGLVVCMPDGVLVLSGICEMRWPAGLGPPIQEPLSALSVRDMHEIARVAGLTLRSGIKRDDLAGLLAEELVKPEQLAKSLAAVSEGARELAASLAEGPPAAQSESAYAYSYYRGRTSGYEGEADALAARGVLLPQGWSLRVMPREIAIVLRGGRVFPSLQPARPAVGSRAVDARRVESAAVRAAEAAIAAVETIGSRLGEQPAKCLKSGGVGARELKKLATAAALDADNAAALVEIAGAAGLVGVEDVPGTAPPPRGRSRSRPAPAYEPPTQAVPTPVFDAWVGASGPRRWGVLAAAWLSMGSLPSLAGAEAHDGRTIPALVPSVEEPAAVEHRAAVLRVLASLPSGHSAEVKDLADAVSWERPAAMRELPPPPRVLVTWVLREAELLGIAASHSLSPIGRAVLAGGVAEAVKLLEGSMAVASSDIVLQGDLTAVVAASAAHEVRSQMERIADVESVGSAIVYRFSEASVRRGLDSGLTRTEIADFLLARSTTGLPQALDYMLGDVARRHGSVRVGLATSYLRCDDLVLAAELLGAKKAKALALRQIAPSVLVSDSPPAVVLERLRAAGYFPAHEDESGAIVVDVKSRRRSLAPDGANGLLDAGAGAFAGAGRIDAAASESDLRRLAARLIEGGAPVGSQPGLGPLGRGRLRPLEDPELDDVLDGSGDVKPCSWCGEIHDGLDGAPDDAIDWEAWEQVFGAGRREPSGGGFQTEGTGSGVAEFARPSSIAKSHADIAVVLKIADIRDWPVRVSISRPPKPGFEATAFVMDSDGWTASLALDTGEDCNLDIAHIRWVRVLTEQEEELM